MKKHQKISAESISNFQKTVWNYYAKNNRPMPWRNTNNAYYIYVSEIMLQQTQVARVMEKFPEFISHFPSIEALAKAENHELLSVWQGMGYNRRALSMRKAAQTVVEHHGGTMPHEYHYLIALPGVGPYTASAIRIFAFKQPDTCIETNIRAVYIHHFFKNQDEVADDDIVPIIEATIDTAKPREWYYALMDYGTYLKSKERNPSRRSKHHTVQSTFKGSDRELRGEILRQLLKSPLSEKKIVPLLKSELKAEPNRAKKILHNLEQEGFIKKQKNTLHIA